MNQPASQISNGPDSHGEEFLRSFTIHQRSIYLYIRSLVANAADADEIWQQSNLALWKKFDHFEPGTSFRAWAFKMAYFEVTNFYARKKETSNLDAGVLESLASDAAVRAEHHDARLEALRECVSNLRPQDRGLIEEKYSSSVTAEELAHRLGRSARAIYKSLVRIRRGLMGCIQRRLARETQP